MTAFFRTKRLAGAHAAQRRPGEREGAALTAMAAKKQKKIRKTYSPAERRRKTRRFNGILYTIAALLILFGIVIFLNDQTLLFPNLFSCVGKTVKHITSGEEEVMPTLPPFDPRTYDPNVTMPPRGEDDPLDMWTPIPTWDPYTTPAPGTTWPPTAAPTQEPGTTRPPWEPPTEVPTMSYAPKNIYFLDQYVESSIQDIVCPVDPVGYNSQGQMDTVRSAFRAGWFMKGGDPVHGGNVLIAAHNRYSGQLGYFSIIKDKLQPGDIVIIETQSGDYYYYVIDSITEYDYDAVPSEVMTTGGEPRLTLITCKGDYSQLIHTSRTRIIAVCHPIYFGEGGQETQSPSMTAVPHITSDPSVTFDPGGGR